MNNPFHFKQCVNVLKSTGKKAKNVLELRDMLQEINDNAIFHHTYQYFLKEHTLEYTNDFSRWAGEYLKENILAEKLSNVDPYAFQTTDGLRSEILVIIDRHLKDYPEQRHALPGDEFYFNEAITLVAPLGIQAKNLAEFLMALKHVPSESVYFHFYEARARLGRGKDDFSLWFEDSLEKTPLAEKVRGIDIFMYGVENSRGRILEMLEEEVTNEMERFGS